jgi:FkbM family methyltransferase
MSACAASIVGARGCVVAVEPQSRLLDLLEINLALNSIDAYQVVHEAVSDVDYVTLSLSAEGNTGGSSIVRKYRWGGKEERVPVYTVERLAESCGVDRIDFVKVDVEGFEPEVVRSLHPLLDNRRVGKVLVDYHVSILWDRGITAESVHEGIAEPGYMALLGSLAGGYVYYGRSR